MTNERFTLNAKVLNQLQETLLTSKKHVEFLAANAPEIRTNLKSIAETLETVVSVLENQIYFNRDNAAIVEKLNGKFELEKAYKHQAYDFIMTEKLIGRFGLFGHCYPVETYLNKTGLDILEKHENK
jgi:hypothetical protein